MTGSTALAEQLRTVFEGAYPGLETQIPGGVSIETDDDDPIEVIENPEVLVTDGPAGKKSAVIFNGKGDRLVVRLVRNPHLSVKVVYRTQSQLAVA